LEEQKQRNQSSHRLGGLSEKQVFKAWGEDINDRSQWEATIIKCLNILTGQNFATLKEASLFGKVQDYVERSIEEI
jgi:hypothetical protein